MAQLSPRIEARHPDLSSRFNHSNRRFHRSAKDDNLTTSLNHLKMIARVTNGVYLQTGLSSGTIPADKLISELLRFGSVTSTQIAAIDSSKIQTAVDTLKSLPGTLKPSTKAEGVEKTLDSFKKILDDIDGIANIKERPRMEEFKTLLTELKTNGVNMGAIQDLMDKDSGWKMDLVQKTNTIDDKDVATVFGYVKRSLTAVKSSGAKLKVRSSLWTSEKFSSAEDGIREDVRVLNAVTPLESTFASLTRKPDEWTEYSGFIDGFIKTAASLKSAQSDVENVKTVVEGYQLESRKRSLNYTIGFPNGPSDIALISVDLNDQWMKDVVKSGRLGIAMNGLKNLEVLAKKVEDVLKAPNLLSDMASLFENFHSINQLVSQETDIKTGIEEAPTCSLASYKSVTATHVTDLQSVLKRIDDTIVAIEKLIVQLIEAVTAPGFVDLCDEFIKICESRKVVDVDRFRNHPKFPTLKEAVDKVYEIVAKIVAFEETSTIKNEAINAINKLPNLNLFQKELDHYAEFFGCLLTKKGVKLLIAAHEKVKEIRSLDQKALESLNSGVLVVKKVVDTSEDLEKLKRWIDEMRGITNPEIEVLKELLEQRKHSKIIGTAVQGVSNMKSVLMSDVRRIVENIDVIKRYKHMLRDSDDAANLNSLVEIADETDKMMKSLDILESSVIVPTSTVLVDLAPIFEKAKMVTGIKGWDYQKILGSLKKLEQLMTIPEDFNKLQNVKESMLKMEELDLDFSSYQSSFDRVKLSLIVLDEFFSLYFRDSGDSGNKLEEGGNYLLLFVGSAVFGLLVAILVIHLVLYRCKRELFNRIYKCCRRKTPNSTVAMTETLFESILNELLRQIKEEGNKDTLKEGRENVDWFNVGWIGIFTESNRAVKNNQIFMRKVLSEYRFDIPLLPETRVVLSGYGNRFMTDVYHANVFKLPDNRELVLAQGPQKESEGKNSTIEKFWYMVQQKGSKAIAMLCQFTEGGEVQCDQYYPDKAGESKQFGDLKVDCLDKQLLLDGRLEIRKLKSQFGNEKDFTTTHYLFNGYSSRGYPDSPEHFAQYIKIVLAEIGTITIHCSDGIRRTGTFALAAYLIYDVSQTKRLDLTSAMVALRDSRVGCAMDYRDFGFSSVLMIDYLADGVNIKKQEVQANYNLLQIKWQELSINV